MKIEVKNLKWSFIFMICAPLSLFSQNDIRTEIDKLIKWHADWDQKVVPGFVLTMVEADTIYHFGYGNMQQLKRPEDEVFELGSISKLFTALHIEKLIKDHKLHDSLDIGDLLNIEWANDQDISLFDLKTHQTNLPKRPDFFGKHQKDPHQPFEHYSKEMLLKDMNQAKDLKTDFKYSHINYALLEMVIEKALEHEFSVVTDSFLYNLNMINSSYKDLDKISAGHDKSGRKTSPYKFPSFRGSEGLKSTTKDLSGYFQNQFNSDTFESEISHNFEAHYRDGIFFKYPWFRFKNDNGQYIYTLTGITAGHHCQVFCFPYTKTAVILFANGAKGVDHLATNVLAMMNDHWKRKPLTDNNE